MFQGYVRAAPHQGGQSGFTLIELAMIIVVLAIVATVAIPKFGNITENSKTTATKQEMLALKKAIIGNPDIVVGGQLIDRGYEGDVGSLPDSLPDLIRRNGADTINIFTRIGWNGPYIDSTDNNYLSDAWDEAYVYDPDNRRIQSTGGATTITVYF